MGTLWLSAACILRLTEMRFLVERPSFFTTLRPAKQLWQPMSAMALTKGLLLWYSEREPEVVVVLPSDAHL